MKTQHQHQAEFCALLEIEHLCRSVGCARSRSQCLTAPRNQRSYRWMLVCAWMVYLRSTFGIWSLKCWERPKEYQNQPKHAHGKPVLRPKAHPRLNKCWIKMWIYRTWIKFLRTHISLRKNHSCTFRRQRSCDKDDHQRQKSDDETLPPAPTELLWTGHLTESTLDPKVQIKYVESKKQLADIPTKGSFTRDGWQNLLHLFNIMNDTTFSCSHFSNSHPFLPAGKQSEMSKRSQERSSPGSPTTKAKALCLFSRHGVSVGQDYSSNPNKSPGSTRDSQVRTWEERGAKSGWYSVQHASGNREYGSEVSGGFSETQASGNREYTRKSRSKLKKTDSDTMNASRKYR